jgi:glutamate 5-kinase
LTKTLEKTLSNGLMTQLEQKKKILVICRRVIIKVGSGVLSSGRGLHAERIQDLTQQMGTLRKQGKDLAIVTSGAVAAGVSRLNLRGKPKTIPEKQAAAAVGQIRLMALYEHYFANAGHRVAQVLLTREDLSDRRRYLNAKHTLMMLLKHKVIPIVNENDTVAVEEIQFGDNDELSRMVATLLEANLLVILSDVEGVFEEDPRRNPHASLVPLIIGRAGIVEKYAGESRGDFSRGGMASKLDTALKAGAAGIPTVVASGFKKGVLTEIFDPLREVGTLILPERGRLAGRKHWIAYTLKPVGEIVVDQGAYRALIGHGGSLLPSGLKRVKGDFGAGECVRCVNAKGEEFARGLVNYSSQELEKIKGIHSSGIEAVLGFKVTDEVIHRDDLVLL